MKPSRQCGSSPRRHGDAGFTLIELMIVLVIMGILAAIAYPSLTEYVRRARRAEAKAVLLEAAAWMERNYVLNNNSYVLGGATTTGTSSPSASPSGLGSSSSSGPGSSSSGSSSGGSGSASASTTANDALTTAGYGQSPRGGTKQFNIQFSAGPTATSYTLQATPTFTDPSCATLTLDELGQRTAKDPSGNDAPNCWTK